MFAVYEKSPAQANAIHFHPLIPFIPLLTTQAAALCSWGFIDNPSGSPNLIGSYFGMPLKNKTYDYVIVGGGTAGLVVANRLSESPNISMAIPFWSTQYVSKDPDAVQPLIDWGLETVPQPQLNSQVIHYVQGKCLGGSSGRIQVIYHRGTAGSYDLWAEQVGDDGFAWRNMLPHFKKSINFTQPNLSKRAVNTTNLSYNLSAYDESAGPLFVTFPKYGQPLSSHAQEVFKDAGFPVAEDFSSGVLNGSQWGVYTIGSQTQTRSSSETSFLQEILRGARQNVKIYTNTQDMQVLFDGNKTATGVRVETSGMPYLLSAKKKLS
ncbi:hypothetical protein VTL71DRAFT_13284 [Oculimacula yallundae]|uniref:Glucose-methanol-choline oxidoreductase N-terminal domain-containing protein n=1 Tax=Oculimacula yallundae TaxID=86028 RepID=A0ABR4CK22_9HELO